ncbi:MAG: GNAT family N-acetyltransferase [Woeseiaceae bacterium]|nr:GNAT family N-acetyltransferase [Woeseiaceae bacterium]
MNHSGEFGICRDESIVTARCRLRYPQESDIPHIWSASQTPNFNDGLRWSPPDDIAEMSEPFRAAQERWTSGEEYSWAIESRADRDFIGWISIRREPEEGVWSIGFWTHPTRQGQGFATECAAAMLEFGFSRLNASMITAAHAPWNTASGRVLQRIGMRCVRRNPTGFEKNREWVEELEYEIRPE